MSILSPEYRVLYIYTTTIDIFLLEKIQKESKFHFRLYISLSSELIKKDIHSLNFDLVFIDFSREVSLPLITDFAKKVFQFFPKLPIVGLSSATNLKIGIQCLELGFFDFIYKQNFNVFCLYKLLSKVGGDKKYIAPIESYKKHDEQLFHLSPQSMYVFDMKTLLFLDVNDAAIKKYGFTKEEFLNMTLLDIRKEEDKAKLVKILARTKNDMSQIYHGLSNHVDKMGNKLTVDIYSNYIIFEDKLAGIVLANDVTDYLYMLKKQNDSLSDILWLQSHKLRAPLVRIMALINDSKQDNDITDQFYLDEIQKASVELDKIIRTISSKASEATYSVNESSR